MDRFSPPCRAVLAIQRPDCREPEREKGEGEKRPGPVLGHVQKGQSYTNRK